MSVFLQLSAKLSKNKKLVSFSGILKKYLQVFQQDVVFYSDFQQTILILF